MSNPAGDSHLSWPPVNILMYHDVDTHTREPRYDHFYVLATEFRRQMQGLLSAGYHPITLRQILEAQNGSFALPKKPFVVTFDDGYKSLLSYVHPVMMELNIPYTVFLVSERVGQRSEWVIEEGFDPSPLLDWPEIAQMQAWTGVDFQAHTATHKRLAELPIAQAREELARSKETLEQRLRAPIDTICYPYGSVNNAVAGLSKELGYRIGVTTQFGRVRLGDDPLRLPRVSVHHVPGFSLKFGPRGANFWWRIRTRKDTRAQ